MHIFDDDSYPRCRQTPESIIHILRDWNEARDFWSPIIKPNHLVKFFSLRLILWLEWNLSNDNIGNTPCNWIFLFGDI